MVIKLNRMVKYEGNFLPAKTIVDMNETLARSLIEDKIAIAVTTYVQPVTTKENSELNKQVSKDFPEKNKPAITPPVVTVSFQKENNESELDDDSETKPGVDISNFKIVEELPPVDFYDGPFQIPGVDSSAIAVLVKAGYKTIESLKGVTLETLIALPKIGYTKASKIRDYVKDC